MKTALVVLLLSSLAFGQEADAPLIDDLPPKGKVLELKAGDVLPWDATVLDKAQALREAKKERFYKTAFEKAHEGKVILPTAAFVGIVVGIAVVVAAGTAAAFKLAEKKTPAQP